MPDRWERKNKVGFTSYYNSMTLDQAINVLEKHQEWRRDNNVPAKTQMQNPKEIGEALDVAIHLMKGLSAKTAKPCTSTKAVRSEQFNF